MRSVIYLAMLAAAILVCGCAQAPADNAPPNPIRHIANRQIGFMVVYVIEVDGQRFVVAKTSEGVAMRPLDPKAESSTGAIGAEAAP